MSQKLYLNSSIGTFTPGEVDLDSFDEVFLFYLKLKLFYNSRRGRRQFLHREVIRKTWLSHGMPSWRVWILGLGKFVKGKRNVGLFLKIYVCVFTVQI